MAYHSLTLTHWSVCFAGRIPTELGQLTALTDLDLSRNQLTGGCDYGKKLASLQLVNESTTRSVTHLSAWFSGRIPTELGQLTALTKLELHNNPLAGECDQNSLDCDWYQGQRVYHSISLTRLHGSQVASQASSSS